MEKGITLITPVVVHYHLFVFVVCNSGKRNAHGIHIPELWAEQSIVIRPEEAEAVRGGGYCARSACIMLFGAGEVDVGMTRGILKIQCSFAANVVTDDQSII